MGGVPILHALTDLPLSMLGVSASKKSIHVLWQWFRILEAGYHDYLELRSGRKYRPSYDIISANDYSFYTVFRGDFDSYNECKQKRDELHDVYNKKAMNVTKKELTNILSFE